MTIIYDGKSETKKSAQKIVDAVNHQRFPWWPTIITSIITGVIVGILVWLIQERSQRERREKDIATAIAITVANDLRISIEVSLATRERLIQRQIKADSGMFAAIYSPIVDLPSASDTVILKPATLNALDGYRKLITECTKHRQMLIDEWQSKTPPSNVKGLFFAYCMSLDSVVRSGFLLLKAVETDYPSVINNVTKPSNYRPIEADIPEIQKVLNDPTA